MLVNYQMIAAMVVNRATGSNTKTNLILAPTALLDQVSTIHLLV